jgi:hypothetical protein
MPARVRVGAVLALIVALVAAVPPKPATHGTAYVNGQWFDGTRFQPRTMYVLGSTFSTRPPERIDTTIDLAGGFVVPPFGDAHYHLMDPRIAAATFLRDGIFYIKDQSNAPAGRRPIDAYLKAAPTFDYVSANQGWTSPDGHPVEVIKRAATMPGPMATFVRDSMDPGAIMQVETREDVDARWRYFLAGNPKPDFVKVYLERSASHARIRNDPKYAGNRGIDPALVPYIVSLAHGAGLKVSAHVFTASDFRNAVNAGVDLIAHLPGGKSTDPSPFLLADSDAVNAAAHHVAVITTVSKDGDSAMTDGLVRDQYAHNIAVLRAHDVTLLLGCDIWNGSAATEAAALARSHVFSNLELLQLWSVTTPRAIFPDRRIGSLDDGNEASFLVLKGDPLADFANTRAIARRVKQGVTLSNP